MDEATQLDDAIENVMEGTPRPGDVIADTYAVDRVIGQGGMGVVLAAHHTRLGHAVAIKVLYRIALEDSEATGRFLREARAALSIRSGHVVRVFDVGSLENGAPYMVMEMLEGTDLEQLVHERGPLRVEDAVDYVLQAAEALAEAHALGIVHRDLKPSNLFLTERADGSPLVKVLDFGIAKAAPSLGAGAALTATGVALGTPPYMSPEQIRNAKKVDERSDVWGMGASLFHLLTGRPPFQAATLPSICAAIVADPTPSAREIVEGIPAELDQTIARCLEKRPENRFLNLAELASALAPFAPASSGQTARRIERIVLGAKADERGTAHEQAAGSNREADESDVAPSSGPSAERGSRAGALDATLRMSFAEAGDADAASAVEGAGGEPPPHDGDDSGLDRANDTHDGEGRVALPMQRPISVRTVLIAATAFLFVAIALVLWSGDRGAPAPSPGAEGDGAAESRGRGSPTAPASEPSPGAPTGGSREANPSLRSAARVGDAGADVSAPDASAGHGGSAEGSPTALERGSPDRAAHPTHSPEPGVVVRTTPSATDTQPAATSSGSDEAILGDRK